MEKSFKNAKLLAIGFLILNIINFISYLKFLLPTYRFAFICEIILLIIAIIGFSKEKKSGAVAGAIFSIMVIILSFMKVPTILFSAALVALIFGILYLIDCIKILLGK